MRPEGARDPYAGPEDGPALPYPVRVGGEVIKGFGRGSKELGIPTANIPLSGLSIGGNEDLESGIYFGWAGLSYPPPQASGDRRNSITDAVAGKIADAINETVQVQGIAPEARVYPMVMSVGWNPFYKNTVRSVEVHIMHKFADDFYGKHLNLVILGFIRPEYDYVSKQSLIEDIETDIEVANRSLQRPAYEKFKEDPFLTTFDGAKDSKSS